MVNTLIPVPTLIQLQLSIKIILYSYLEFCMEEYVEYRVPRVRVENLRLDNICIKYIYIPDQ